MSTKSLDSSLNKQNKNSLLSQKQLDELKNAFSDLTKGIDQPIVQGNQKNAQKKSFFDTLIRLKTTFSQINSRQFTRFAQFSTQIQIGKQIAKRPQLLKVNMTMSIIEILAFAMSVILPKKYVNKALFSLTLLTVEIQIVQKLALNYFVEQIALGDRMQPIEQQARNLIQYKYRIHPQVSSQYNSNSKDIKNNPSIQKLLAQIDKKNQEYFKFKKVSLLV